MSHLAIANRILKQQEKATKTLRDRLAALETAESKADAAVEVERGAHNVAEMRLFGLEDDLKMYKDQVMTIDAAIFARKRRFSAIWKLTAEIWLQIFQFVVFFPPHLNSSTGLPRAVICPAHSLDQICQLWSGVIADNPTLKGYIYITTLALTKKNQEFIKKCLEDLEQQVSMISVQTGVGLVSQAQVLVKMFQGWTIHETEVSASKDSIEAAQYLLSHLPTSKLLLVSSGDTNIDKKDTWWLLAQPKNRERLQKVVLHNFFAHSGPNQPPWDSVQEVEVHFTRPYRATVILATTFVNITKLFMTGNPAPRSKDINTTFVFPHLTTVLGSVDGLINTFDAQCRLPALRYLSTWIYSDHVVDMAGWKAFVQRYHNPAINHVDFQDVASPESISRYAMELRGLPTLELRGKTVDSVCLAFKDQKIMFSVQTLIISNYAGDGSAVFEFVKACSDVAKSQIIPRVIWINCDHVTLPMRAAVGAFLHKNEVASLSQPATQAG
ncbi:hypothetical protein M408DRAFT_22653 [Serendipita vermifera MAFF 305830]|uniref:Uncharacterized protein n=1 Tax=Serendipita vermifera MAFF 305830 TaxID=933852 RepID=A0A0C2WUE9_SERVB|nr:hypothetical protein M408DRAFT_22653 [Serendipita vermifera MAFF 305830]